jgi:uncharacterized protein YdhG (YjbR/CyaY superfamily)
MGAYSHSNSWMTVAMLTIDEYLAKLSPGQRAALGRIRNIVKQAVPEAEETISYDMPTFKFRGKRLVSFAAFKEHMSIFGNLGSMEEKLDSFTLSHKGTLRFTEDHQVPKPILTEIILMRATEISKA